MSGRGASCGRHSRESIRRVAAAAPVPELLLPAGCAPFQIDTADIRSADGTPGRAPHFGREHDGRQYRYDLHLYIGRRYIHILEIGGLDETLEARRDAVDEALSGYRIRR